MTPGLGRLRCSGQRGGGLVALGAGGGEGAPWCAATRASRFCTTAAGGAGAEPKYISAALQQHQQQKPHVENPAFFGHQQDRLVSRPRQPQPCLAAVGRCHLFYPSSLLQAAQAKESTPTSFSGAAVVLIHAALIIYRGRPLPSGGWLCACNFCTYLLLFFEK